MTFIERRGRARQGICTSSASARQTKLMTKLENVYNLSKSACIWTRDLTQHHFFITKQHFLARILRQWRQQIIFMHEHQDDESWNERCSNHQPLLIIGKELKLESQPGFKISLILVKGSNIEVKFVHTNWSKIIKVGTQTNECDMCAGTSI